MFNHNNWQLLQLFGGEGASGASAAGEGGSAGAAATGENTADAGQQRLRELGVPENKIRKPRAKQPSSVPAGAISYQANKENQAAPQAAAANVQTAQTENAPARMSWDEIVKDPEYNAELQKIIKSRIKVY